MPRLTITHYPTAFFVATLTLSGGATYSQCVAKPIKSTSSSIEPSTRITKSNASEYIKVAIERAKKHDWSFSGSLSQSPELSWPLLSPYLAGKDSNIRLFVIDVASNIHTPQAVASLSGVIGRNDDASSYAVDALYNRKRLEIVNWGGKLLMNNLFSYFQADLRRAEPLILLSCFKNDKSMRDKVLQVSKSMPDTRLILNNDDSINETLSASADIVLSEMGDKMATARVVENISRKRKGSLMFVLASIKYIDNKVVLLKCVEILRDKRRVNNVGLYYTPKFNRMCDLAYQALEYRSHPDVAFDSTVQPYKDVHIVRSYNKYRNLYKNLSSG